MNILKIIGVACIGLIVVVLLFLVYMGMFSKLNVQEKEMGPYTMAFEKVIGPYSKTKVAFDNVYNKLKEKGFATTKGIGIYYDDPAKVPANELRSDCGSIIGDTDFIRLIELQGVVEVQTIAASKALVVEMPIRNVMSYMFGPMKAYPAIIKYAKEMKVLLGDVSYEIYDMPNKKIYYVFQEKS
ncbi:MAG: hypothetical protein WCH76_00230 [Candidatus Riflemargulisbacteria bacterium]